MFNPFNWFMKKTKFPAELTGKGWDFAISYAFGSHARKYINDYYHEIPDSKDIIRCVGSKILINGMGETGKRFEIKYRALVEMRDHTFVYFAATEYKVPSGRYWEYYLIHRANIDAIRAEVHPESFDSLKMHDSNVKKS